MIIFAIRTAAENQISCTEFNLPYYSCQKECLVKGATDMICLSVLYMLMTSSSQEWLLPGKTKTLANSKQVLLAML